eukprot:TRINITY_DN51647_c0_g1_i1.p1 TRINITY_DN51647_c0_g1~~TRINITY_DN51647_c0_g1_i1.p1  ORF type:complete len:592 (+),score=88.50 TRINITY_DN51647_c0_g1_i1:57-1832(+)
MLAHSPVITTLGLNWDRLQDVTLAASAIGSCWLIRASWNLPPHLFNRQLRHLAAADLGMTLVDPCFELFIALLWSKEAHLPKAFAIGMRSLMHFFLFVVCAVETQIAAGVLSSSLRWQQCPRYLAAVLPFTWPVAVMFAACDAVTMATDIYGHDVAGSALATAIVICASFILSLLFYGASIVAVLWTPSPSAVVRRASRRALAFPCSFLATMFLPCLMYLGVIKGDVLCMIAVFTMYCIGWVNAAVYGLQNRRLCRGMGASRQQPARCPEVIAADISTSFHVGFSTESCRSASMEGSNQSSLLKVPSAAVGVMFELRSSMGQLCVLSGRCERCSAKLLDSKLWPPLKLDSSSADHQHPRWFTPSPTWLDLGPADSGSDHEHRSPFSCCESKCSAASGEVFTTSSSSSGSQSAGSREASDDPCRCRGAPEVTGEQILQLKYQFDKELIRVVRIPLEPGTIWLVSDSAGSTERAQPTVARCSWSDVLLRSSDPLSFASTNMSRSLSPGFAALGSAVTGSVLSSGGALQSSLLAQGSVAAGSDQSSAGGLQNSLCGLACAAGSETGSRRLEPCRGSEHIRESEAWAAFLGDDTP